MTTKQVQLLDHGFYILFWKSGGYSYASVGSDRAGNRWMAPCNWVSGSTIAKRCWREVKNCIKI